MTFTRLDIPDVILCKPTIFKDERGSFLESYRHDKLCDFIGYNIKFCQSNQSKSILGVLRGLHYQLPPYAQTKLVHVVKGSALDVVVDIRKGSPTFSKHLSVELSEKNNYQLFVPRGFAHGFIALTEEVVFSYKVDNYYNSNYERGIVYNDKSLNIDWKLDKSLIKLSDRDLKLSQLINADIFDYSVNQYI